MRSFLKELNKLLYSFLCKSSRRNSFYTNYRLYWYYRNVHYDNSGLDVK